MTRNNAIAAVLTAVLMCGISFAQAATVKFAWDASDTVGTANNPIKYKLYVCKDAAFTQCTATDAGTALLTQADLAAGTYWVYATAYMNMIDTEPTAGIVESSKSNVLNFVLQVPPGNPKNFRIRIQ